MEVKMLEWTKSVRALTAIIFVLGLTLGLFIRIVPVEIYSNAALLVIGAYFAKRDNQEDRGQ
jgi:hypothetical protein